MEHLIPIKEYGTLFIKKHVVKKGTLPKRSWNWDQRYKC